MDSQVGCFMGGGFYVSAVSGQQVGIPGGKHMVLKEVVFGQAQVYAATVE